MAKSKKAKGASVTAADGAPTSSVPSVTVTDSDVARRAYELYQIRGGEHGAERELQRPSSPPRRDGAI